MEMKKTFKVEIQLINAIALIINSFNIVYKVIYSLSRGKGEM